MVWKFVQFDIHLDFFGICDTIYSVMLDSASPETKRDL